jgi:hypothetical protein
VNGQEIEHTYVRSRARVDGSDAEDGMVTITSGETLPIKFRIEQVAAEPADTTPRLAIRLDSGVIGSPAASDTVFPRGRRIHYRFDVAPGYENLLVMIDGHYVKARGTIIMDGTHSIYATADRIVPLPPGGDTLLVKIRALLASSDPDAAFQDYIDSVDRLYSQVGEEEADRRLAALQFLALDPARDEAALERLDSLLAGHTLAVRQATGIALGTVARASAARIGPTNPTVVIYVNGILNTPLDAAQTTRKLQRIVNESQAPNVTAVRAVYNRTLPRQITPAGRRARLCMQDMTRSRNFLSDLSLDLRFSHCMGDFYYLYNFDLPECFRQVLQLIGVESFPPEADARVVADTVLHYMTEAKQNVILVPHSQGNLMVEQAVNLVHADSRYGGGDGQCLSVASLAAPTSQGWSLTEGRDLYAFIINHDVLDALLKSNTFDHLDTPLSRQVDAELGFWRKAAAAFPGAGLIYGIKVVTLGLAIHSATESYMSDHSPESRGELRENLETLATRNCHRSYALVGTWAGSDPVNGCFDPFYIHVTERSDGAALIDQWNWGYKLAFSGVVSARAGSFSYTAHVSWGDPNTPYPVVGEQTWNVVLTPKANGHYSGAADVTYSEKSLFWTNTQTSKCTADDLARDYV